MLDDDVGRSIHDEICGGSIHYQNNDLISGGIGGMMIASIKFFYPTQSSSASSNDMLITHMHTDYPVISQHAQLTLLLNATQ